MADKKRYAPPRLERRRRLADVTEAQPGPVTDGGVPGRNGIVEV